MKRFLAVAFLLVLLGFSSSSVVVHAQDSFGYPSSFQNPRAEFYGVEYEGKIYTPSEYYGASIHRFDTQLKFDPDGANDGKPNLLGSMTTVFIPSQSLISVPSWLPNGWLGHASVVQNPVDEVSWNISGKAYDMRIWNLHFFVSLDVEWDHANEVHGVGYNEQWYGQNTAIWIKFNLEPIYYIQGAELAYFAVGKMQLFERVEYRGWEGEKDIWGNKVFIDQNPLVSVSPEGQGDLCYIYYQAGGEGGRAETDQYYYQGHLLNPDIFTDAVYARIDLNHFGARSWWDWFTLHRKGDVALFSFSIQVFEIGQWLVQDIQDDPTDFGRFVRQDSSGSLLSLIIDNLWWIIPVAIIALIVVFAPWIIILIISIFK